MVGPRVFEAQDVDAMIPDLELVFDELDGLKARVKTVKLRINALEMIWGEAVNDAENPDHDELRHHLADLESAQEEYERLTQRVTALGGQIKGLDPPLVDFYGVRDGFLVLLCWTRGEGSVGHWHHVDEGFSGRRPL